MIRLVSWWRRKNIIHIDMISFPLQQTIQTWWTCSIFHFPMKILNVVRTKQRCTYDSIHYPMICKCLVITLVWVSEWVYMSVLWCAYAWKNHHFFLLAQISTIQNITELFVCRRDVFDNTKQFMCVCVNTIHKRTHIEAHAGWKIEWVR